MKDEQFLALLTGSKTTIFNFVYVGNGVHQSNLSTNSSRIYNLTISYGGKVVNKNSISIYVSAGAIDPSKSSYTMSINERILVETYGVLIIQAKDAYGNNCTSGGGGFKVFFINTKASDVYSGTPYDYNNGKFMFPFRLEAAGTYQIKVTYNEVQVIGQQQIVVLQGSTEAVLISYITPTLVPTENYTTLSMFGDNLMQIISFSCIFGDFGKRPGRFNTSQEMLQCDTPYIKEALTVQLAVHLELYQGKSTFNFDITFYVDRPPVAVGDRIWSWKNSFVSFSPLLNDQVAYGSPNLLGVCQDPKNGTVEVVGSSLRYTPQRNFTGIDKLTYTIGDFRDLIAHGDVSVSVYALTPQIVSSPQVLVGLEDQPIPTKWGIQGLEITNPNIAEIVTVEVQAGNGHLKFAEDSTSLWQGVHILSYDTLDEHKPNSTTKPSLKFTGTFTLVSSALQALRYQGDAYFNGNDFIKLDLYNKKLKGSSRDILVMLKAKNDPPFINSSTLIFLNSSYWKTINVIPIEGISIGDPDQRDVQGSSKELHLQISLEVSSRSIQISINSTAFSTIISQEEGSSVWITPTDESVDEDIIIVIGRKIKFEDSIESCNTALKSLKLLRGKPKDLKNILLTVTVNDLGNFGCYGSCTTNSTVSLQATIHTSIVFEFTPPDIRAKVAASVTCSSVLIIYISILIIRYHQRLAYKFDDGTLGEEDMLKKTRVFNPAWSMDAKRESSFDFGVAQLMAEKEDKFVEKFFEPPIIYEEGPHDDEFSSLLVHQMELVESPPTSEKPKAQGKTRRNIFIMDE